MAADLWNQTLYKTKKKHNPSDFEVRDIEQQDYTRAKGLNKET